MKTKILTLLTTLAISSVSMAQIINVPGDQPTIQAGIDAASGSDIVLVDTGTYYENINFKGKAIIVKSHYDPVNPDSSLILNTIIDGSQPAHPDSGSVVYYISGETTNSILQGFTIQNGSGTFPDLWGRLSGGGVICLNSSATLLHNRIINNQVHGNPYNVTGGGGVCVESNNDDTLIMKFNILAFNEVIAQNPMPAIGGGIFINMYSILENNIIKYNYIEGFAHGGGIAIYPGKGIVRNNLVVNNTINTIYSGSWGGGIYIESPEEETRIISNTVINNTSNEGGGIAVWIGGQALTDYYIDKNIIHGNSASFGAGISINSTNGASVTNNVIQYNEADQYGGGIYLYSAGKSYLGNHLSFAKPLSVHTQVYNKTTALHQIANNTITQNIAGDEGGGINSELSSNEFLCFNNVFFDNAATSGEEIYLNQSTVHLYNNNIDPNQIEGTGNWLGDNNINVDPLFDTDGYHLLPQSQCIEAGVSSIEIDGEIYYCPEHDIDGDLRPLNAYADIGVDECLLTGLAGLHLFNSNSIFITPNPVKGDATIMINLIADSFTNLRLYDIHGRVIQVLINDNLQAGNHQIKFESYGLKRGIYFYVLKTNPQDMVLKAKFLKL